MLARPMGRRTFTGLLTVAVAALVPDVLAQAGYKTFENKLKGITFVYPTTHAELPLPPTEALVVAKYVMKAQPEEMKRVDERIFKQLKPSLTVFCFDLAAPKTPGGNRPATGEKPASGDPATLREVLHKELDLVLQRRGLRQRPWAALALSSTRPCSKRTSPVRLRRARRTMTASLWSATSQVRGRLRGLASARRSMTS